MYWQNSYTCSNDGIDDFKIIIIVELTNALSTFDFV